MQQEENSPVDVVVFSFVDGACEGAGSKGGTTGGAAIPGL